MQIISIKKIIPSGNHGRVGSNQTATQADTLSSAILNVTPRVTERNFIPPSTTPIKKSIPTLDLLIDPPSSRQNENTTSQTIPLPESPDTSLTSQKISSPEPITPLSESISPSPHLQAVENISFPSNSPSSPNIDTPSSQDLLNNLDNQDVASSKLINIADSTSSVKEETENPILYKEPSPEVFKQQWKEMFDTIFIKVPTLYYSLKDIIPAIANGIITVKVRNEIQKEHFDSRIRMVIEFFAVKYNFKINDIVIVIDEKMENKKIIYDNKDKLNNLTEQNAELPEFLQILKLNYKD